MLVLAPLWLIAVTTSLAMAMGLVAGYCIGYIRSMEDMDDGLCQYSARHYMEQVLAVGTIDCGPVGIVPACQKCIDFYAKMTR